MDLLEERGERLISSLREFIKQYLNSEVWCDKCGIKDNYLNFDPLISVLVENPEDIKTTISGKISVSFTHMKCKGCNE